MVQLRRFCVAPNEGFQAQLHEYEPIYRAEQMQQRFADAARGDAEYGQAGPKRTYDDAGENMDDDEEDEHGQRNPSNFAPPVPIAPLAGHSAHVHRDAGGGRFDHSYDDSSSMMEPA